MQDDGGLAAAGDVYVLRNHGVDGLSTNPTGLMTGQNSGYQAINLAILAGARRVLLLGFDMQLGPGGKEHWFGAHPVGTHEHTFSAMLHNFRRMARVLQKMDVEVINCTRGGVLDAFPRADLEQTLARLESDPQPTVLSS